MVTGTKRGMERHGDRHGETWRDMVIDIERHGDRHGETW